MIYLGPGGYQVAFDLIGLGLLLAVVLLISISAASAARNKPAIATLACSAALILAVVQLGRGVMAPGESWIVMLAAIEEAKDGTRERRVRDLQAHWKHREMRAIAWYQLSNAWGVCHRMWHEQGCRTPSVREDAMGVAREILDDFVGNPPYQAPTRK